MNYVKQHDENKQISMTGARAIIMLIALLQGPKSFEEIHEFLYECGVIEKEYSVDTIRIDINTLKMVGCEITKATKTNNHKYRLISHPFHLDISKEETDALIKVYDKIVKTSPVDKLLQYHRLFQKLASLVEDPVYKDSLQSISVLNRENIDILEQLISIEKKHNRVTIEYQTPYDKDSTEYDLSIEKLGMRNGKLYVYCTNNTTGNRSFLNVSRIKSIVNSKFDRNTNLGKDIVVRFKLTSVDEYELEDNENIIEQNEEYTIVEGKYFNDFIAIQRMLSFADDCTVLAPDDIKEKIITRLKEMRAIYE